MFTVSLRWVILFKDTMSDVHLKKYLYVCVYKYDFVKLCKPVICFVDLHQLSDRWLTVSCGPSLNFEPTSRLI